MAFGFTSGGLAGAFGHPEVSQFIDPRRNMLLGLAAGLVGGPNWSQGLSSGFQMAAQGGAVDRAAAEKAKADELAAKQTAAARTWFEKNAPQYVPMIDSGMSVGQAWNQYFSGQGGATTDDITEYNFAKQNGFTGTFPEWMTTGKQPQTVINNTMGATDEFYNALDKGAAGQVMDTIAAGNNARGGQIRLMELEKQLQTAPQGIAGGMTQMAGALGIPVEGLDEVQAAQALINQMVPLQRAPGSGPMSDKDLELFKASLPSIMNQPGGNQKIIAAIRGINEYTIKQAEIAQAVANREITPAEGRKLAAQVPNPLQGFSAPASSPGGSRTTSNGINYTVGP